MPRKPKFDATTVARTVIEQILKLDARNDPEKIAAIPGIFAALDIEPMQRYEVFQMLDEKPGYFGSNYYEWHAPLRRCRNTPDIGKKMFDTFKA